MATAIATKCSQPVCSCVTMSGKYCSTECAAMEKTPDIDYSCGHSQLQGQNVLIRNMLSSGEQAIG